MKDTLDSYLNKINEIIDRVDKTEHTDKEKSAIESEIRELFETIEKSKLKYEDLKEIYFGLSIAIANMNEKIKMETNRDRISKKKTWKEKIIEELQKAKNSFGDKMDKISTDEECQDDWLKLLDDICKENSIGESAEKEQESANNGGVSDIQTRIEDTLIIEEDHVQSDADRMIESVSEIVEGMREEENRDTKVVMLQIARKLKSNSYDLMSIPIRQAIVDQVVQDTNALLADSELSDSDLEYLLTIYEEAEEGLKLTEKTEYLQMAIGFMTQIIEEKQEERRTKEGGNPKDEKDGEIQNVSKKLEGILDELEQVIKDAESKKRIEKGTSISIESKGLLEQKKLTPEQIEKLFDAYARAKEALDKLDSKTKKQSSVKNIIDTATEFQKKRTIAAEIKYDSKQAAEAKEKQKEKQKKEIEKRIKVREEINLILKKYKSDIKKFISAYEKVKQISGKYGEKRDTYKQLSDKIKKLENEILEIKESIKELMISDLDETRAKKAVRIFDLRKKIGKLNKKLNKKQGEIKKLRKDIKAYNESFKLIKNIRTTIAQDVSSSNEWSKTTREYINEKSKSNQTFYGLAKEKQAEKDFEVSPDEIEELEAKAEEVRWLKYEKQPAKENNAVEKGKKVGNERRERTTSSTTQRSGGREEASSKSKWKSLRDKLFKSKKDNEDVDYEVDEYKKLELRNLSDELKKKMILEYYKDKGKDRLFGGIWARFKAFTSKGKAEWEREFLRKEERIINPDQAAKYRKTMAMEFEGKNHIQEVAAGKLVDGKVELGDSLYIRD